MRHFPLFLLRIAAVLSLASPFAHAQEAPPTGVSSPPPNLTPEAQHGLAEKLAALSDADFTAYLAAHREIVTPTMVVAILRFGRELGMHGDGASQAHAFARAGEMAALSGDALSKARVLWRQAGMEGEFHHTDKGITMINEAIAQATAAKAPPGDLAGMLGARVVMFGYKGDYARAMADCDQALRLATEANSPPAAMAVLTTLINIYQRQGQPAQSLPYLAQARKWAEGNDHMTMYVDGNYAETYHLLGDAAKEQEYLQRALATARRIGDDNMVSEFLPAVAQDAYDAGNFKAAHAALDEAFALANRVGNDHARVDVQLQLAKLELAQGHHDAALATARTALAGAQETGEWESVSLGQDLLGQALADNGQAAEAETAFRAAVETIEQLRVGTAGGDESRQATLQKHIDPYQRLVARLVADGKVDEAFSTAESAKARVLRDILESGRMDLSDALTDDERKRKTASEETLASLNRDLQKALNTGQDTHAIEKAQAALDAARVEGRNLENALFAAHPEVRKREPVARTSATDVSPTIGRDPDTLLLEFVTHADSTTVFMAGPGKLPLEARTLPIGAEALHKQVDVFRNALADRSLGWREGADSLGRLLLAPAGDRLAKSHRVIVVPDGPLWDLPFQVLRSGDDGACLLDRCAVSYTPSAAFLDRVRQNATARDKNAPVRLLAMGNPSLGTTGSTSSAPVLMGAALVPLPEAEDEVRRLTEIYGRDHSRIFLGGQAREETFKREAANFDVLHLATHGLLNNANPLYSCLLMAQTDLPPGEDGFLEAREIMNLHLHARLAILDACETARGTAGAGEGQLGLSWALMVAGCPASVVSQWKVDSHTSTELMVEMHRQLHTGKSVDEALRHAELAVRKTPGHVHPFYWAPFVVVGDAD